MRLGRSLFMSPSAAFLILLVTVVFLPVCAFAGAGDLDPTFNGTGKVLTDFFDKSLDMATAVALDSQGRIVVAGRSNATSNFTPGFALARYMPDGSLDTSFGSNGLVTTAMGKFDQANAVAVDSQGRIIAAGEDQGSSGCATAGNTCFAVVRYSSNGSLDSSFGTGGVVVTQLAVQDIANAVAVDASGNVVVAGCAVPSQSPNGCFTSKSNFAVVRYDSTGSLDTTFGTGGIVQTNFGQTSGGTASTDMASGLAIDAQGRIVLAGSSNVSTGTQATEFALARYDSQGNLDTSFGTHGLISTAVASFNSAAQALTIDSNGKIVAAGFGQAKNGDPDTYALARYNPTDGSLDNSFGFQGKQVTTILSGHDAFANAVAIDSQGRIVAAGAASPDNLNLEFAITRYTPSGTLDNSFGSSGIVTTTFESTAANDSASGVVVDGQDRIIAAGFGSADGFDFALACYKGVVSADLSITNSGAPNPVLAGNTVTYTIGVTNLGPDDADGIVVADNLPSTITFVSCSATNGGVCGGSGNNVTVSFASLANGSSATVTLVATVNAGTPGGTVITNTVTVSSNDTDPNQNNNSATSTITVQGTADVAVGEVVTKNSNRQLAYALSAKNLGPDSATQLTLTDVVPSNARFVSVSPGAWTCSAPPVGGVGTLTCTLSSLSVNQTQKVTMTVKAANGGNVSIINTVSVSTGSNDPSQTNNSATLTTHVNGK